MSELSADIHQSANLIYTGIAATLLVLAIAALLIAGFTLAGGLDYFIHWVGTFFMCATPFQIMMALCWSNQLPESFGHLGQPLKGIILSLFFVLAGSIVMPILFYTAGHGVLTPILIHYVILSVAVSLLVLIVFGCWPANKITDNKFLLGLATLAYCYLLAFLLFELFYDYSFFKDAPFYSSALDPGGMFNGITALTFAVTVAAIVMVYTMFECWPVPRFIKSGSQPASGIAGTVLILLVATILYYSCVSVLGMEPMDFMIRGPVCIIFGTFLVDNMMQFQLFSALQQPLKGLAKLTCCLLCALAMYQLYKFVLPFLAGQALAAGPEAGYAQEIWIATAMLGITFPVINFVAGAFNFWPIMRD